VYADTTPIAATTATDPAIQTHVLRPSILSIRVEWRNNPRAIGTREEFHKLRFDAEKRNGLHQ
jgi:hypothetical protein